MKHIIFPHKAIILLLSVVLLVLQASFVSCNKPTDNSSVTTSAAKIHVDTTARIVMEVSRSARLYTTEYKIHKVVTYTDNPTVEGKVVGIPVKMPTRLGDRKVAIPIDVTLKAYIDFNNFSPENVKRADSTVVITLPDPQIIATATRIDNTGTRQYIDLARSRYTDAEITALASQGTDSIMSHISQFGIVAQAERSAATILVPILRRMGYKDTNISIRFRKNYTDSELIRMIQKQ